jgi:hypothetical protein
MAGLFVVVVVMGAIVGAFILGVVVGDEYAHQCTDSKKPPCAASERTAGEGQGRPGGLDGESTSKGRV